MTNLFSLKRKKHNTKEKPSIDNDFGLGKPTEIESGSKIDTEILKQNIAEKMKIYKPR